MNDHEKSQSSAGAVPAAVSRDGDFAKGMLLELARMGASPAGLALATQLFGVGPCEGCGFRKLYCRCDGVAKAQPAGELPQLTKTGVTPAEITRTQRDLARLAAGGDTDAAGVCVRAQAVIEGLLSGLDVEQLS